MEALLSLVITDLGAIQLDVKLVLYEKYVVVNISSAGQH
jgi:hypothetical protein